MPVKLRPLIAKLNETTRNALEGAVGLCLTRTHYDVEIEHYLAKLIESDSGDAPAILKCFQIDTPRLAGELYEALDRLKVGNPRTPSFSPTAMHLLREAWVIGSINLDADKIRSGFTLLALVSDPELARLTPRELQKLDASRLERDFAAITAGSIENPKMADGPQGDVNQSLVSVVERFVELAGEAARILQVPGKGPTS